jgi:hypothetical protein
MRTFKAKGNTARRVAGTMNKTEEAFSKVLEARKQAGEIHHWSFEAMALRLADRTTYTPDFFVIEKDGLVSFWEVKGFWHQAGRIKIKVAAENHPWFSFTAVQYKKKEWSYEQF